MVEANLNHRIDQVPPPCKLNGASEQRTLKRGDNVRDDYYQPCMQGQLAEEAHEIDAIVRDEDVLIVDDSVDEFPIRLTAQTKMVDVSCFEPRAMSDSDQRLMQAFVDEEPHALFSKVLSG